jgi:hypothetical protein
MSHGVIEDRRENSERDQKHQPVAHAAFSSVLGTVSAADDRRERLRCRAKEGECRQHCGEQKKCRPGGRERNRPNPDGVVWEHRGVGQ